jgi:hypothetical protein
MMSQTMTRAARQKEARLQAADCRTWKCQTCEIIVQDGERYCWPCESYWEDCRNGLWSDRTPLSPLASIIRRLASG